MMHGISMNELCELISQNCEAEFEYNGTTFVYNQRLMIIRPIL